MTETSRLGKNQPSRDNKCLIFGVLFLKFPVRFNCIDSVRFGGFQGRTTEPNSSVAESVAEPNRTEYSVDH